MRKRKIVYLLDYITFWNNKGDYGKERVRRMRERKRKRFEKWHQRKQRRGYFYDKSRGCMMQVCEYQPSFNYTSYCEYPCNGDC
jgi:hypothetical protein